MQNPLFISSAQNPKIKLASALRDSKERRKTGSFLIDGTALIRIAVESNVEIEQVFLDNEQLLSQIPSQLWNQSVVPACFVCERAPMDKLQYGGQSHSMIAIAKSWPMDLGSLKSRITSKGAGKLYLVLDQMEKPGNLGAALRTADAAGVDAVLLSDPICDPFNPNAIRSSLGALFTVPVAVSTNRMLEEWLQQERCNIFTARVEGSVPYTSVRFDGPTAIVIGNEAEGLRERWEQDQFQGISIPMRGKIDSLNASVSTAILLFEAVRQRSASNI